MIPHESANTPNMKMVYRVKPEHSQARQRKLKAI